MIARHLLLACLATLALTSCKDGARSRLGETPRPSPNPSQLHDGLPDAAVVDPSGGDGNDPPEQPAPTRPDAGPTEEIDNTIYWDAATKPTADNVRGIDAGEPDR